MLRDAIYFHNPNDLAVHIVRNGIIYRDQVKAVATTLDSGSLQKSESGEKWRAIFLLVPMKLGANSVNKLYLNPIKALLRIPHTLGIIGGRPKQALYFVGYQGS